MVTPTWDVFKGRWARKSLLIAGFCLLVAALLLVFGGKEESGVHAPVSSMTELEKRLRSEVRITRLTIDPNTDEVEVREEGRAPYRVAVPMLGSEEGQARIVKLANKRGVEVASVPRKAPRENPLVVVMRVLPTLLILTILLWLAKQYTGGFGSGRRIEPSRSATSFGEVAGVGEAVEELREVREFLADPQRFTRLGARVPKGVLLHGPPGSGKTLLSKAVASEAGVPFFACSGSEFVEMFAGLGARRVRQLFEEAKKQAPSIIFIDELDAVGGQRAKGGPGDGAQREADQTLIQILNEMDGFEVSEHPVIVIGATNRIESLDSALIRPGRFDRHIAVDPPDKRGRLEILEVHAKGKPFAADVELDRLASQTAGMTGAELALILNEAALRAARRHGEEITAADIDEAFFRVVAGAERQHQTLSADERRRIAYHEAGHAIIREALPGAQEVHKISIIPRGRSGGQTVTVSAEDVFLYSQSELRNHICGLLGGRAAEQIVFDEVSSGAADDLQKATSLAERLVAELGMGEAMGLVVVREDHEVSPHTRERIEDECRTLLDDEYSRALQLLRDRRDQLEAVAQALLEEETLDRERFLELIGAGERQ